MPENRPQKNKGFTLIEILVVLAIFSVFVVLATDLFLTINRVQRETRVSERLLSESRYVLETISNEVRRGAIDYIAYGDPVDPEDAIITPNEELIVITENAEQIRIKKDTTFCPSSFSMPCVVISRDGGATWASMTPLGIKVVDFKIIIHPRRDPFYFSGTGYLEDEQPKATVIITLGSTEELGPKYIEISNQTTVSMRTYGR
jgi:prepilin-type N-terminal cleavage/methylation domain-containing protein